MFVAVEVVVLGFFRVGTVLLKGLVIGELKRLDIVDYRKGKELLKKVLEMMIELVVLHCEQLTTSIDLIRLDKSFDSRWRNL